jgi:hypothetical protein
MSELCIPLDYEQLSEIWQLRRLLALSKKKDNPSPKQIEAISIFVFHRLFVTLGYQAKSTNKPGLLTEDGVLQLLSSLEPLFGEDCDPLQMLVDSKTLTLKDQRDAGPEYVCPLFAKYNQHLAGNFKPAHLKGNVISRLNAAMKNIPGEAHQQMDLLSKEIFRKQDNSEMNEAEKMGALVMIKTLDRCLMKQQRATSEFGAGILATACSILERHDKQKVRTFYLWLANHYEEPAIPQTADEILADFDRIFAMAQQSGELL